MSDRVGQRFGNYRLRRLLSDRGAFADVYEGEHVVERTQAAVKVWKVQIEAKAFLNDVHAAILTHPHIVKILDFGINGDVPYLVMAYAPNGSLQAQRLPLPLDTIVSYVRDIADALQYAHQHGIVHRDIKPDNILLGPRHEIWVGDFGIATPSYTKLEKPEAQSFAGTPPYIAPEQWHDQASSASDQYALGIMVYEWLCGDRPFHGNAVALYQQHNSASPPPLRGKFPTIPTAVEQVVMTALEKEPHQRFANVGDFATALEQASQEKQRGKGFEVTKIQANIQEKPAPQEEKGGNFEKAKQPQKTMLPAAKAASSLDTVVVIPVSPQDQNRRHDMTYKLCNIAQGLIQQGHMEKALEAYDQILKRDSTSSQALNEKGILLFQLGKHQEGMDLLDEALKLAPTDRSTLENKARLLIQLGRCHEGIAIFDDLIKRQDDRMKQYQSKGLSYPDFYLSMVESKVAALLHHADALMQMKLTTEATKLYDEVILIMQQYNPRLVAACSMIENQVAALLHHADALMQMKLTTEAIKLCDDIILIIRQYNSGLKVVGSGFENTFENQVAALIRYANVLMQMKLTTEAIKLYDEIILIMQRHYPELEVVSRNSHSYQEEKYRHLYEARAKALYSLENYEETVTSCDEILSLIASAEKKWRRQCIRLDAASDYDSVHLLKAQALTNLGRFEEALSSYKRMWYSDSASIRRCIGWVLEKLRKYPEAIEEYEKAYKELPRDTDLLIRKGNCLLNLGNSGNDQSKYYNEALQVFDIIIELDPANWNAWRSKGIAFEGLYENEKSLDSYRSLSSLLCK